MEQGKGAEVGCAAEGSIWSSGKQVLRKGIRRKSQNRCGLGRKRRLCLEQGARREVVSKQAVAECGHRGSSLAPADALDALDLATQRC